MTQKEFLKKIEQTFQEGLKIIEKKSQDYSGDNPLKNFKASAFIGIKPEKAILIRMLDKISRVNNLLEAEAKVDDESLEDSLMDLVNYSAILKVLIINK